MTKFEVYNVFAAFLEYFENNIHFCQDIQYTITLSTIIMKNCVYRSIRCINLDLKNTIENIEHLKKYNIYLIIQNVQQQ